MKKKDLEKFMEYLKEQFPGCIDDDWTGKLIENVIDYAYRNHGHSKGAARNIVYSLLPDVSVDEELYTLSDGILALIRDAGDAKKLVHREQTQLAIDEEVKRLTALNSKICGMMKE